MVEYSLSTWGPGSSLDSLEPYLGDALGGVGLKRNMLVNLLRVVTCVLLDLGFCYIKEEFIINWALIVLKLADFNEAPKRLKLCVSRTDPKEAHF